MRKTSRPRPREMGAEDDFRGVASPYLTSPSLALDQCKQFRMDGNAAEFDRMWKIHIP